MLPPSGFGALEIPVCRKVYTPDLVCEMVSNRFVHLRIGNYIKEQNEDFDVILEDPVSPLNESIRTIVITSGGDCPSSIYSPTRVAYDFQNIGS